MRKVLVLSTLAALVVLPVLADCSKPSQAQKAPPMPPPPHVNVLTITPHPVALSYPYAGRIAAFREVDVRARVSGVLTERSYVEGAKVNAGDVLFRIDPASYEADLAKAKAQVQQAQAQLAQAQRDSVRIAALFQQKIESQKARDDALSAVDTAKASLAGAQAQVRTAEISLSYTTVKAPITGITSVHEMAEGSLVGTGSADTLLTRITQLDPVYVNFAFTESALDEVRRLLASGQAKLAKPGPLPVRLILGDGTTYAGEGHVDFTGSSVDQQTGTIQARAIVPNPDHRLIPGQFVRIVVTGIVVNAGIVVPEKAVMQGPQGQYVYAVDKTGKAAIRPIVPGRPTPAGWLVPTGLAAGERIIVDGIVKVRPGAPVTVDQTFATPDEVHPVGDDGKPAAAHPAAAAGGPLATTAKKAPGSADARP